jgi:type IV pilus assembly protein PilM
MKPSLRTRPWAGIDLGSYSVKVVALLGDRHWMAETPIAVAPHERETPEGREAIARTIDQCLNDAGLPPRAVRGVTLGVGGADVIIKQIALPYMDEAEVGPALRFEARKHLPFDPQGMVIDFQIIGRSMTEKRLDILLAAVPQERLDKLTMPCRLIGLDPDIVDATPLALTNALLDQVPVSTDTQMILDLGHASSHLIMHQRTEPYFSRRLEFGGRTMTQAISRGMKIPFEEAEAWKRSLEALGTVDWSLPELGFVLDSLRFDLLEEVRRSVAFYRTFGRISESFVVWLSGGAARVPGLADRIAELLETQVRLFDPLKSLNGGNSRRNRARGQAPQYSQALGLALRSP